MSAVTSCFRFYPGSTLYCICRSGNSSEELSSAQQCTAQLSWVVHVNCVVVECATPDSPATHRYNHPRPSSDPASFGKPLSFAANDCSVLIEKASFVSGRDILSIERLSSVLSNHKDTTVQPKDVALVRDPVLSDKTLSDTEGKCWKQSEGAQYFDLAVCAGKGRCAVLYFLWFLRYPVSQISAKKCVIRARLCSILWFSMSMEWCGLTPGVFRRGFER